MLFFVGLGIDQSPSEEAIALLKRCNEIYYESYTSPRASKSPKQFSDNSLDQRVRHVTREFVEDGRKILESASQQDVALLSSGDPMIATTHQELRVRAIGEGIATRIIHGSSILSSIPGELGLHAYSFGKCVTMTREPIQYTAYETIFQNLLRGLHTMILLEWDEMSNFFMAPAEAVESLESAERDLKYGIINEKTLLLGASRIGMDQTKISACSFLDAPTSDFGEPPISLVIPGRLHFTEQEALAALTGKEANSFPDNSAKLQRLAQNMISRYGAKTSAALKRARTAVSAKQSEKLQLETLFENVDCYSQDAVRFLNQGKDELAVLSIGYAEGLLDALRFLGILSFDW